LAGWAARDEVRAVDALRSLAIEAIASAMIGLGPGPELDALLADYGVVLRGFQSLPVPLPGTGYARAKAAVGRVLATWEQHARRPLAARPPRGARGGAPGRRPPRGGRGARPGAGAPPAPPRAGPPPPAPGGFGGGGWGRARPRRGGPPPGGPPPRRGGGVAPE